MQIYTSRDRYADRKTGMQTNSKTYRYANRQMDRFKHKDRIRQKDRQTERQTLTEREIDFDRKRDRL